MTSRYRDAAPYVTKDGSEIRELMHPSVHGNRAQCLAEATVAPGAETRPHRHRVTEELYHVTQGTGSITLGARVFDVGAGDTVCIPPGTPHRIRNTGRVPLRILCCCSPAYSHDDAQLLQPESAATGVTRSLRATAQSGSAASAFSRPSR
jgi:mannose-6-phosphate isomerase-like protein (cupin superfamily)